jgi:hypothetical protein
VIQGSQGRAESSSAAGCFHALSHCTTALVPSPCGAERSKISIELWVWVSRAVSTVLFWHGTSTESMISAGSSGAYNGLLSSSSAPAQLWNGIDVGAGPVDDSQMLAVTRGCSLDWAPAQACDQLGRPNVAGTQSGVSVCYVPTEVIYSCRRTENHCVCNGKAFAAALPWKPKSSACLCTSSAVAGFSGLNPRRSLFLSVGRRRHEALTLAGPSRDLVEE